MADSSNNLKRPAQDDDPITKRSRSNDGSPIPVSNGSSAAAPKKDISAQIAAAKARADAVKARLQGNKNASPTPPPPQSTSSSTTSSAMDRIAQAKARVAAATARASSLAQTRSSTPSTQLQAPQYDDGVSRARGGLDVGLHPALMAESGQDSRAKGRAVPTATANRKQEPTQPHRKEKSRLDLSGPSIEELKQNPYYDASLGLKQGSRHSRQLIFNQKGKYIGKPRWHLLKCKETNCYLLAQAAALRRQAQLESMKKRIAERARQAGIDEDPSEKNFVVPAPPTIEWWDEGLIDGDSYNNIQDDSHLKIETPDSIITAYIQHPVLLQPPQEKIMPAPKPMFLTRNEQRKMRRQRRMAELKEAQAKVRLGLEPAPPPKVKKSNLMRVLGEEAVKDPTAVEARVNKEIAARLQKHEDMNEARKLTDEQRREKLATQQGKDLAKGIWLTVYRIDSLANGRHRFKINKNAEQNSLTGICIMNPKFCLVIVEGGIKSVKNYQKLMLNRIDWSENSGPSAVREGNKEALAKWLDALDEQGELKDLGLNQCKLVFEGEQRQRAFRRWVGLRTCETEASVKETLSRQKLENFWTVAKGMGSAEG
ncbi:MAG: hypothetical protein Q9227_005596 [Pyrenula ochraceoflavens]